MKYRAKAVYESWDAEGVCSMTADTVIEDDNGDAVPVGLLDRHGRQLYRIRERVPIGFYPPRAKPSSP